MTILVTSHRNDRPLARALGSHATIEHLDCGDANLFGVWSNGDPLAVSVERKKVPDLIQCLSNGRLLAQLQSAAEAGFDHQLLIVEGDVTYDANEYVVYRRRRVQPDTKYLRYHEFLYEIGWYLGVPVVETTSVAETADRIIILDHMLQRPPEAHTSLHTIYTAAPPLISVLGRPSLRKRVAHQLPGVGWHRAGALEKAFPSVSSMINATQKELEAVEGLGRTTARTIKDAVQ